MLKVDVYVKTILTIIAISLVVIIFRPVFSVPAKAWGGYSPAIAISEGRESEYLQIEASWTLLSH